jgi:hypothetical protein
MITTLATSQNSIIKTLVLMAFVFYQKYKCKVKPRVVLARLLFIGLAYQEGKDIVFII